MRIQKPSSWKLAKGQSVAVDGVCSTVASLGKNFFEVEYIPETLSKTTAGTFSRGASVNLERSMTPQSLLDGHIVLGHVDARAAVADVRKGKDIQLHIAIPKSLVSYVVPQGSLAVNGVSLTVAALRGTVCTVALVPYTLRHTNLGALKRGDTVNIEVDILARYLGSALRAMLTTNAKKKR